MTKIDTKKRDPPPKKNYRLGNTNPFKTGVELVTRKGKQFLLNLLHHSCYKTGDKSVVMFITTCKHYTYINKHFNMYLIVMLDGFLSSFTSINVFY